MAMIIGEDCTACGVCVDECDENNAISEGDPIYVINPALCSECVPYDDKPRCVDVCPVGCIVPDPAHKETKEELEEKYNKIHA